MKKTTILLLVALPFLSLAQSQGPLYRQFAFNPYPFNPAFAGINKQAEINLTYRRQWTNFQDAPTTAGINYQVPVNERVSLGFNLFSDKQVLLLNNSFMASFAYAVPLSADQVLRFGISGGVGRNGLNLSAENLNTNDPAIIRAAGNNYYFDGNFGAVYTYGGLKLGFALTNLFQSNTFSTERFSKFTMSNLKNRLYSASYRFDVGRVSNIALEPYVLYRQSADGLQDYWEAATIVHFNDRLSVGAAYNQHRGLAMFLGLTVKEKLRINYAYEFPPFSSSSLAANSHEIQMSLRFGKQVSAPSHVSRMYRKYTRYKAPQKTSFTMPVKKNSVRQNPKVKISDHPKTSLPDTLQHTENASDKITAKPNEVTPSDSTAASLRAETSTAPHQQYYVIAGVFKRREHAANYAKKLLHKGHYVGVMSTGENKYYVHVFSTNDFEAARSMRDKFRNERIFRDAWVFTK